MKSQQSQGGIRWRSSWCSQCSRANESQRHHSYWVVAPSSQEVDRRQLPKIDSDSLRKSLRNERIDEGMSLYWESHCLETEELMRESLEDTVQGRCLKESQLRWRALRVDHTTNARCLTSSIARIDEVTSFTVRERSESGLIGDWCPETHLVEDLFHGPLVNGLKITLRMSLRPISTLTSFNPSLILITVWSFWCSTEHVKVINPSMGCLWQ